MLASLLTNLAQLDGLLVRTLLAAAVSLATVLILGSRVINWLRTFTHDHANPNSSTLQQLQAKKVGTPTMGGMLIVLALLVAVVQIGDLANPWTQAALLTTLGLGVVGASDDLAKLRSQGRGLSRRGKLLGQFMVASLVALWLVTSDNVVATLFLPGHGTIELGPWLAVFAVVVMLATTNAVNLVDGLDGLASGCVLPAAAALGTLLYLKPELAEPLSASDTSAYSPRELLVVVGALLGATLGFLRFNLHPARVFMGDTGALVLGGLLGLVAVSTGRAWAWLAIGGVFVAETLSVIVQIAWFKLTGRRVFRCAPLHHHYQFLGWNEVTIVHRFWGAALCCALVGATVAIWSLQHESAALIAKSPRPPIEVATQPTLRR